MHTTTTTLPRTFGIGTRTEIRLGEQPLVTLSVHAGELLRSEDGVVWATIDGEARDILLDRGDVHRVARDGTIRVSAFGPARLEIYGNGPLRFEWPQHTAGGVLASVLDTVVARLRGAWPGRRAGIAPPHAA